jgi:hypothetical protein
MTGLFLGNATVSMPAVRYALCGGALPHGDGGGASHGGLRCDLSLVPQNHGSLVS